MQRSTPFYSPAQAGGFVYCIIAPCHSFCHSEHMQFKVKTAGRTYSPPRLIQLNYLNLFTVSFFIGFDTFFLLLQPLRERGRFPLRLWFYALKPYTPQKSASSPQRYAKAAREYRNSPCS